MPALLSHLPPPPPGKTGWPWTVESEPLPPTMPDGKPWPKISIVTPSYNQGQFIEETIRSVLLQNYPNLEYFIIDGKSTDESVEIIKKYEPWLTYWVSEKDRGQSDALMKGFRLATGELYAWLNSDDYYLPVALKVFAEAYVDCPDLGVVYSDYYFQVQANDAVGTASVAPSEDKILEPRRLSGIDLSHFNNFNPLGQPSCCFSSKIFWQVGGLDEALHYSMDYDLSIRIFRSRKNKVHVGEFTSVMRLQGMSKTCTTKVGFSQENLLLMQRHFGREAFLKAAFNLCCDIAVEENITDFTEVLAICRNGMAAKESEEIREYFVEKDLAQIAKSACAEKTWKDLLINFEHSNYTYRLRLISRYLRHILFSKLSWERLGVIAKALLPLSVKGQIKRLADRKPLIEGAK